MPIDAEKLAKLKAAAAEQRTGGPGTMRRPAKKVSHSAGSEERKVQQELKKQGVQPFQGIDEVNLFHADNTVTHISQPKVQANFQANTYVVSGKAEKKTVDELMPGILPQLGINNMAALQEYMKLLASMDKGKAASAAKADEDIPEVSDFSNATPVA